MNMMWYTHLVDVGTQALVAKAIGALPIANSTFVAARVIMNHRRELRLGQPWQTWSGFSSVSERSFTAAHKITSGTTIAARCSITIVPFDYRSRIAQLFPRNMVEQARSFVIAGLTPDM
jgi:acyl-CoA thioesterase FadM